MTTNGSKADPPNLDVIIKLLKMTTSSNDMEALSFMRKANALLKEWGWEWEAIMRNKIKIMPNPFENLTRVMPNQPQPSYSRPAPAAPPPPPKQFDDKAEIEKYFEKVMFKKLPQHINQRLASIERTWNTNGFLLYGDYDFLRTQANSRRKY